MTEKRDEADLPSPLVVMFWLNEQNQMRPIACATEDKREDSVKRAAQCYNYSTHDYVPFSALESVTRERDAAVRRVGEMETAARKLLVAILESTKEGVLTESDDHFFSVDDYLEVESIAPQTTALESLLTPKEPSDA